MAKRWMVVGGVILAVLLATVVVLLVVVIGQNNAQAEQDRYDRARQACEMQLGPMTEDNLEAYSECAARLLP